MWQGPHSISAFDPLLRDLLRWELVTCVEDAGSPRWELVDEAHQRLSELRLASVPPPPERLLYLDRRCYACGRRAPTRLRGEHQYVCDACAQHLSQSKLDVGTTSVADEQALPAARRRRRARRRGRGGERPPIAS